MMARIEALWEDEAGTQRTSPGKLEDMSNGGLSIRVKDPIGLGSKLIIRSHIGNFPGTVIQCRQDGREYVLGIKRDAAEEPDGK